MLFLFVKKLKTFFPLFTHIHLILIGLFKSRKLYKNESTNNGNQSIICRDLQTWKGNQQTNRLLSGAS